VGVVQRAWVAGSGRLLAAIWSVHTPHRATADIDGSPTDRPTDRLTSRSSCCCYHFSSVSSRHRNYVIGDVMRTAVLLLCACAVVTSSSARDADSRPPVEYDYCYQSPISPSRSLLSKTFNTRTKRRDK